MEREGRDREKKMRVRSVHFSAFQQVDRVNLLPLWRISDLFCVQFYLPNVLVNSKQTYIHIYNIRRVYIDIRLSCDAFKPAILVGWFSLLSFLPPFVFFASGEA